MAKRITHSKILRYAFFGNYRLYGMGVCLAALLLMAGSTVSAAIYDVTIDGSDAIFLAGRTDVTIPPASEPWTTGTYLIRHSFATPEEIQETLPPTLPVAPGDVVRVLDPASGGVSIHTGFGVDVFGPGGNGLDGSNLNALGGISGYLGPQGPLTGVFLDNSIPSSGAPATLDFSPSGLGTNFSSLSPGLGQVFYIGDGVTSGGVFQEFTAPAEATRLALGIPDGFSFVGDPGAYDDNDGAYRIRVGINEVPPPVPVPGAALLGVVGLASAALRLRRRTM